MRDEEAKARIMAVLKGEMPIKGIAAKAGLSVATASKYCHILEAERRISMHQFGNMKLVRRR